MTARQAAWSRSRQLGIRADGIAGGAIAGRTTLGMIGESAPGDDAAVAMAAACLADPAIERVQAVPSLVSAR